MKAINLTKTLLKYKTGWVAIDETKMKVIAHAKDFNLISKKINNKQGIFIMPVSDNYFGFITLLI
ncbi:hypothetical protein A3A93_03000 [Candidatus Roizmanbacteria bacterium RIFCSPLOWO2_01_FULL_38_12]|uniref:DUF5678 domain-containing protein n=1 Tax=Candidatus Roizmanbacteria bacterium RIFCSPLOWO2_01_FULL_38_12 TaxID=1802061 RepID=A0A1F7IXV6_9BACT|nr:MAG: hypothetical protein A3F59_02125 [Candidatus Roizmanbacteria bacterium RIFCSPHIGHO2_12_FULL_38_13]OGK48173.1 MAG: hypothetical protein A3A93_03000 [Candidatus Roizmanbacteria bacterium RIFCSPLOWO2_01_FULL_38_12]